MAVAPAAIVDPDYALFSVVQKVGIKVYVCNILHAKCTTLNFRETECDIAPITNRQSRYLMFGNTASYPQIIS